MIFLPVNAKCLYSGEAEAPLFITGELVNETILRYGDWGVLTTRQYLGTVYHYAAFR